MKKFFKMIKRLWILYIRRKYILYESEGIQINLTNVFGMGKEPTLEEIDTLIKWVGKSWFPKFKIK